MRELWAGGDLQEKELEMAKMTQDIEYFTTSVLRQIPEPWTEDITLDVFETIKGDEVLMRLYEMLVDSYNERAEDPQGVVNVWIAKYVRRLSGRESAEKQTPAPEGALVGSYRKLY